MTAPTIALLDEDPAFLSLLHDLLTAEGYRTLRCRPRDVVDAHALVKRSQPQLVLLDRWWRGGNEGWEFLKHLWADPRTTHIGVVLMSGQALAPSLQAEVLRAMRCRVVRTPVERHELLGAIEAVLGQLSMRRIPDRRAATVPAPGRAAGRASEALVWHAVAARAGGHGAAALDAASDS